MARTKAKAAQAPAVPTRIALGVLMHVLSMLPVSLRRWLAVVLAPVVLLCTPKRRRIIDTNLRYCFPEMDAGDRRRAARHLARRVVFCLLDIATLWRGTAAIDGKVKLSGEHYLRQAHDSGRPVILLTPHTAGLEIAGAALAAQYPMIALTREPDGGVGDWILRRIRCRSARYLFDRRTPMRRVIRALHSGGILYYLPDEDHGRRRRTVFVPYFGRMVNTVLGSGRLVALTRAQVLPCVTTVDMRRGEYFVRIDPPLGDLPMDEPARICKRLRQVLEGLIRDARDDYLWSQRIFQTLENGSRNADYGRSGRRRDMRRRLIGFMSR